jgi:hypothetical protein
VQLLEEFEKKKRWMWWFENMVVNLTRWNLACGKVLYLAEKLTSTTQMQNQILW